MRTDRAGYILRVALVVGLPWASGAGQLFADTSFRRGDADGNGDVELTDGVRTLGYLFSGRTEISCEDAADANDDGDIDIADAVHTLNFLFLGGKALPPPGLRCGPDPTEDSLGCELNDACSRAIAPILLVARGSVETVRLEWFDDGAPEISSYRVYRSDGGPGEPEVIASNLSVHELIDTDVQVGVTLFYRIAGVSAAGEELVSSNEAAATPFREGQAVTVSLAPSRRRGVAPLAIHFDASGTQAFTTSFPFHELQYRWDFDDPESGVWRTNGMSRNSAEGPIAAHVFEQPGTYTVRLAVRDLDGNELLTSVRVTAEDPDDVFAAERTTCFANAPDDWSGAPAGARRIVTDRWSEVLGHLASGRRLLLRRGDVFRVDAEGELDVAGPTLLSAFGSGAAPVVQSIAADTDSVLFSRRGNLTDCRVVGITFDGGRLYGVKIFNGRDDPVRDILWYQVVFRDCGATINQTKTGLPDLLFLVDSRGEGVGWGAAPPGASPPRTGAAYLSGTRWVFLGNDFEHAVVGTPPDPEAMSGPNGEYLCRWTYGTRLVCSFNRFGGASRGNNVLRLHAPQWEGGPNISPHTYSEKNIFSFNEIMNDRDNTVPVKFGEAAPDEMEKDQRIRDIIFESNWIHDSISSNRKAFFNVSSNLSLRNNVVDMSERASGQVAFHVAIPNHEIFDLSGPTNVWCDNNTVYSRVPDADGCRVLRIGETARNVFVRNNLLAVVFPADVPRLIEFETGSDGATAAGATFSAGNLVLDGDTAAMDALFVVEVPVAFSDFTPGSQSTALDAGIEVPVAADGLGNPRTVGDAVDVGALERQP